MTTADMALKVDPAYRRVCEYFIENPVEFGETFARAWFKLLHRDMGPKSNYIAGDFRNVDYIWQDPVYEGKKLSSNDEDNVRKEIKECGLSHQQMVETAWASASTFRGSDNRGGANGARIRLEPQISWLINNPKYIIRINNLEDDLNKILTENNIPNIKINESKNKSKKFSKKNTLTEVQKNYLYNFYKKDYEFIEKHNLDLLS